MSQRTRTMLRRTLVGGGLLGLSMSGLAFAGPGLPGLPDQAEEKVGTAQEHKAPGVENENDVETADVPEHAQQNQSEAEARHAAATAFAEQIREWTTCIRDNARPDSPEEAQARDDSFDPKVGCEELAPETTPGGQPFDPYTDDEAAIEDERPEDTGPPEGVGGPPEGAGRPEGAGGPPEGTGTQGD